MVGSVRRQAITRHVLNEATDSGASIPAALSAACMSFDQEYTALVCWVIDHPVTPVPMELAQRLETLRIAGNGLLLARGL